MDRIRASFKEIIENSLKSQCEIDRDLYSQKITLGEWEKLTNQHKKFILKKLMGVVKPPKG